MKILALLALLSYHKNVERAQPMYKSTPNTLHMNEGEYIYYKKWLNEVNAQPLA